MPTPVVDLENMRKHLTPGQKAARLAAQQSLARTKTRLVAPKYIKDDAAAFCYWKSTVRRMKGITLLDDLDSETLAIFCQILSRRDWLSEAWRAVPDDEVLKRLEAQERLALSYAEKLGLTPSGRVRLAKRRAEEKKVDADDDLYGDDG